MIKNNTIKKFLVNNIFPFFSLVNKLIKKDDNTIFFYCANDELNDNSLELFDFLVRNGYNKKYKIVCGVGDPDKYISKSSANVEFIPKSRCIGQYMKSGHVFYSMGKMPIKPTKEQCVINIWHGIPIKKIGKLLPVDSGDEFFFTYVCSPSELYRPIMAKAFGCPESSVCICGEQKQDRLFEQKEERSEKLIVWTPTFRQSSYLGYDDTKNESFIPPFENTEWEELNSILKQQQVQMVVKLHPMQNTNGFSNIKKSNLKIMNSEYFNEQGLNLYSLLAQSDALIADYSSVYLEYLVINRPICFSLPDFDEYKGSRGFVFENPLEYMPGHFAKNKEDIYEFIRIISKGEDPYKEKRELIRDKVHYYKDGNNCHRILNISKISI